MVIDDGDESILQEAHRITHTERNAAYGHPLDNFQHTAGLVNALLVHKLGEPLDAGDIVAILRMVKESRQMFTNKRDNLVDIAGYAWVENAIYEERHRRMQPVVDANEVGLDPGDYLNVDAQVEAALSPLTPMEFKGSMAKIVNAAPPQLRSGPLLSCGCVGIHKPNCRLYVNGEGPMGTPGPKDPSGEPYFSQLPKSTVTIPMPAVKPPYSSSELGPVMPSIPDDEPIRHWRD